MTVSGLALIQVMLSQSQLPHTPCKSVHQHSCSVHVHTGFHRPPSVATSVTITSTLTALPVSAHSTSTQWTQSCRVHAHLQSVQTVTA